MGATGLRRGLDPVRSSSRITRLEGRPVRIPHQMQRPGKEADAAPNPSGRGAKPKSMPNFFQ
jgi:hypothetical protein